MTVKDQEVKLSPHYCCREIENFVHILRLLRPPRLELRHDAVETYGDSVFLNGVVGGDHIIYVDFDRRYDLERRIRAANEAGDPTVAAALANNCERLGILVGDILLLYSDGLAEHVNADGVDFVPDELEKVLRRTKHLPAKNIYEAVLSRFLDFAAASDDVTLVIIKKGGVGA